MKCGRHRAVERQREVRDLEVRGDAADADEVRLDVVDRVLDHVVAELVDRVDVLADPDRRLDPPAESGVARDVVALERLLHPGQVEAAQRVDPPGRVLEAPALVGVGHERQVADDLADLREPLDVLGHVGLADLDLVRPVAGVVPALDLVDELGLGQPQVDAARVDRHLLVDPAQDVHDRAVLGPADEIPEGDVHGAEGVSGHAGAAEVVRGIATRRASWRGERSPGPPGTG